MGRHTYTIRLDESLSRRLRGLLNSPDHGYASLDELIEVALTNQLNAEAARLRLAYSSELLNEDAPTDEVGDLDARSDSDDSISALLRRPPATPSLSLIASRERNGTLSPLTNRFGPIKIAVRVCASMATDEWPLLAQFRERAAEAARHVGLQLRASDSASRRWVALPVGEDIEKTKARYANSFTIGEAAGVVVGPLALLGLADMSDGRVVLTRAGWRLAAAPAALLGEMTGGATLCRPEIDILRAQLLTLAAELSAVRDLLRFVEMSNGKQSKLDDYIQSAHPEWSRDAVVAHRAAMLGRLADLDAVEVIGRGSSATVRKLADAAALESRSTIRDAERT